MNHSNLNSLPPKSLDNDSDEDQQEYQEKLFSLENHKNECRLEGKYVEAQMVQNRINELKIEKSNKKLERLLQSHTNERNKIESNFSKEVNDLNEKWDKKMEDFMTQRNGKIEELNQKFIEKEDIMDKEIEESFTKEKPHFSVTTLNMKKMEEELAKQGFFEEAHNLKISGLKKAENDLQKWESEKKSKVKNMKQQLEDKRMIEENALLEKLDKEQRELEKLRESEAEELIKKYNNLRKITESNQKKELSSFEKKFQQTQKNIKNPTKSVIEGISKSTILKKEMK